MVHKNINKKMVSFGGLGAVCAGTSYARAKQSAELSPPSFAPSPQLPARRVVHGPSCTQVARTRSDEVRRGRLTLLARSSHLIKYDVSAHVGRSGGEVGGDAESPWLCCWEAGETELRLPARWLGWAGLGWAGQPTAW